MPILIFSLVSKIEIRLKYLLDKKAAVVMRGMGLILKVNLTLVLVFFLTFHSLIFKIEIRLKYFLDKNPPNQPL